MIHKKFTEKVRSFCRRSRAGLRTLAVRVYFWLPKSKLASVRWQKFALPSIVLTFFIALFIMGYYLRDTGHPRVTAVSGGTDVRELRALLETGTTQQRLSALRRLIELHAEPELTHCLASPDPAVVQLAITGLWECWLDEAGPDARRAMDNGVEAMNAGDLAEAAGIFKSLLAAHPDWAEAANKLATVLYLQGRPEESIGYCHRVVALKPDHFGAWNGMAVCAIQTEDWALALQAVEESLRLQPNSPSNRQLLQLVRSRLQGREA